MILQKNVLKIDNSNKFGCCTIVFRVNTNHLLILLPFINEFVSFKKTLL